MAEELKKIICCLLLLAMVGTVSGVGFVVSGLAGCEAPRNQATTDVSHGDSGMTRVIGQTGSIRGIYHECHFPIGNLPVYYICIMFCKIGGGGDTCAPMCEAQLSICT
jgi:hypothetical protein